MNRSIFKQRTNKPVTGDDGSIASLKAPSIAEVTRQADAMERAAQEARRQQAKEQERMRKEKRRCCGCGC